MAKFDLEIPHKLDLTEVRSRLDRAKGKLEAEYQAQCTWAGEDKLLVTRKGLEAAVNLLPDRLRVDVELSGFVMSAASGAIRSGITKKLTDLMA
jgi:putative polyhydroxyalkanoate system protein